MGHELICLLLWSLGFGEIMLSFIVNDKRRALSSQCKR
jgi:hypothetical protein